MQNSKQYVFKCDFMLLICISYIAYCIYYFKLLCIFTFDYSFEFQVLRKFNKIFVLVSSVFKKNFIKIKS